MGRLKKNYLRIRDSLEENKCEYSVINDSISADTTSNGLARLSKSLKQYHPEILIIAQGGNDGLRALDPKAMKSNLLQMIALARAENARVLLVAVRLPPNYGQAYLDRYRKVFFDIADEQHVALVPRILDEIGGKPQLMQEDGIHPTAAAQKIILSNIWKKLRNLLRNCSANGSFNSTKP